MSEQSVKSEHGEGEGGNWGEPQSRWSPYAEMAACCGPGMAKRIEGCPCASAIKRHWRVALAALAVLALAVVFLVFLINHLGGILGIIAFFRTL